MSSDSSLLNKAAHSGTEPGCGDCVWTVVPDCPNASPATGTASENCYGSTHNARCKKGQYAELIFLSTKNSGFAPQGVYCLGRGARIIDVGRIARLNVERYLKDVTPPPLRVTLDPSTSLAGLATKVTAGPPASLRPRPFGGSGVTETITIAPARELWRWGDGTSATFAPGKDGMIHAAHTYSSGGHVHADVSTTWGATYTITYQGQTFGPYNATGTLTQDQTLPVRVATSTPVLVSH